MVHLPTFELPLQEKPPSGYGWSDRALSTSSTTTAFNNELNARDVFLGEVCCVVCGIGGGTMLQNCHIVMQSKPRDWYTIKDRGWIPSGAKAEPQHEPRNGLIMCANHHLSFDAYEFFIRYCPDVQKFVFINHADAYELRPFHGKAIALDIKDRYAPFPSLFIIHEMRVRGHNPFAPAVHELPDDIPWQDWILSMDLLIDTTNSFKRNKPPPTQSPPNPYSNNSGFRPTTMNAGSASSNQRLVAMNADVINDILAATFAMPSWRACQIEGTSWTGTGEENIKKYISSIGVEDESDS